MISVWISAAQRPSAPYSTASRTLSTAGGGSSQNVEEVIISVVDEMLTEMGIKKKQLRAIAAGAPGVIDQDDGIVLFSPNLPWRDYDIASPIRNKFGAPFYIGNDVNVGVLGEHQYGAAKGYHNVVGFFVGTGMGGGLILNDKLFTGNAFKAAEYGHMVLNSEGPLCNCGQRGCLESFSSKKGMVAYIAQQVNRGRKSYMSDKIENNIFKSRALQKALEKKDAVAMEAVGQPLPRHRHRQYDQHHQPGCGGLRRRRDRGHGTHFPGEDSGGGGQVLHDLHPSHRGAENRRPGG